MANVGGMQQDALEAQVADVDRVEGLREEVGRDEEPVHHEDADDQRGHHQEPEGVGVDVDGGGCGEAVDGDLVLVGAVGEDFLQGAVELEVLAVPVLGVRVVDAGVEVREGNDEGGEVYDERDVVELLEEALGASAGVHRVGVDVHGGAAITV